MFISLAYIAVIMLRTSKISERYLLVKTIGCIILLYVIYYCYRRVLSIYTPSIIKKLKSSSQQFSIISINR